jgi:hypothetical protein
MMGGRVKGGQILGEHPSAYNPADTHNTGYVFAFLMLAQGEGGSCPLYRQHHDFIDNAVKSFVYMRLNKNLLVCIFLHFVLD